MARSSSRRDGQSTKKPVIEHLFFWRYDENGGKHRRYDNTTGKIPDELRTVYTDEVVAAGVELAVPIANKWAFFKDLGRYGTRNSNWPDRLKELRWTAVQFTGHDEAGRHQNFRFLPYVDGQPDNEPFLDDCQLDTAAVVIPIQSVTMSVAAKQIRRVDEPRIMQIAVELRIIESHFSMQSPLAKELLHIDHIQMGMKLGRAEIDALFQAELGKVNLRDRKLALITVEAKQKHEYVTFAQIIAQIRAASKLGIIYDLIVPLVVKHRPGGIHVVEFNAFPNSADFNAIEGSDLERKSEAFYHLRPSIEGLGEIEENGDSSSLPLFDSEPRQETT